MNTKIIILGSQGFIGTNLINHLSQLKYLILSIGKKNNFFKNKKIKHIKADIYKSKKFYKYIDSSSIIIFLSASKFNFNDIEKFKKLVNIFKNRKIKKLLFLSSASVYGNNNNIKSELVLKKPVNKQGKFFIKFENAIIESLKNSKTSYTILRTFNVFGKLRKKGGMIESFIQKLLKGDNTFHASGLNNLRSYIHVNDLCKIILKLSFKKKNLILNVCNPNYIFSLKDICICVYKITKKKFLKIIIKKNKNIIQNSVCIPKKLLKMNFFKFNKNFDLELKKIIKENSL